MATGGEYPYLWLDAKVERVRERGGVCSTRRSTFRVLTPLTYAS
ncbi:MAG: hypothetical protein WAN22_00845 [Solirubrobacteraceae bacterium]